LFSKNGYLAGIGLACVFLNNTLTVAGAAQANYQKNEGFLFPV
jgi:hypothetical protein